MHTYAKNYVTKGGLQREIFTSEIFAYELKHLTVRTKYVDFMKK